jgi:hypothetical protein
MLRIFAAPVELRTPRALLRQWKDSDMVRDETADFDHPRAPDGSLRKQHPLHRISTERWRHQDNNG